VTNPKEEKCEKIGLKMWEKGEKEQEKKKNSSVPRNRETHAAKRVAAVIIR